jgi:hypothetical protein
MSGATFKRTKSKTGFENIEQARQRLEGTVVTFDGLAAYVSEVSVVDGEHTCRLVFLPDTFKDSTYSKNKRVRKHLSDPLFKKFKPFDLGFINLFDEEIIGPNTNCMFTFRRPIRSGARQGLAREAIDGSYLQNSKGAGRLENWNLTTLMSCQSFADMINGKYPSYSEALENLIPNSSIAFNRNYAVLQASDGLVWLYRQLERIALIQNNKEVLLFSKKKYLREEMQETSEMPRIQAEI